MQHHSLNGNILVVDDTAANLRLLQEILSSAGLKVRPASSGELAIKAARLAPPDLILLDVRMPGLNGFDVCKQLKTIPETSDTPIIFVSAMGEVVDRVQGFELGAVDYITKPFEPEEILQRIRTHLELHHMRRHLAQMVAERTLQLQAKVQALKTLSEINQALVRSCSEAELLQRICRATHDSSDFPLVWIGLLTGQPATLVPAAHMGGALVLVEHLAAIADQGPTGVALTDGLTSHCPDITACACFANIAEQLQQAGLRSAVALPLRYKDGGRGCGCVPHSSNEAMLGVITVFSTQIGTMSEEVTVFLHELADNLAFGICHLRAQVQQLTAETERLAQVERLNQALGQTIRAMAKTLEKRDPYTAGHQARVAELALAIGQELGLVDKRLEGLHMSAMIHDLGKIYVPAEILNRPGNLSHAEWQIISAHSQVGHDIVKDVDLPWPVAEVILQHHERMDGSGYPRGLKGEEILLEARIIAVADVLEAMSSHRPYRPAVGVDVALAELEQNSGKHYDPTVVTACLKLFRQHNFRLTSHGDVGNTLTPTSRGDVGDTPTPPK